MADTLKILAQSSPAATTLTDVYTVPAGASAVISSIFICNRAATSTSFRVSIAASGAADDGKQYIYYDVPIIGNDTFLVTAGITLGEADVLRVYASDAVLSFTVVGVEVT